MVDVTVAWETELKYHRDDKVAIWAGVATGRLLPPFAVRAPLEAVPVLFTILSSVLILSSYALESEAAIHE